MSPVFSTPAGATVTYLSSTWPWSLHASSRNMTFWNDLLSALAQFSLFSSSTATPSRSLFELSPTITTTISTPISRFHEALKSHGNARDNLKQSINQSTTQFDFSGGGNLSTEMMNDVKMLNLSGNPSTGSSMSETLMSGTSNFTTDSVLNSLVDCNDFTEQKLLNIVICSISDVNNNLINGSNNAENSTFNETLRNISDDLIRLYNFNNSYYYNETEVSGNDTEDNKTTQFESTIYFIQVITTAVVLGIIILATVIGELTKLSNTIIKQRERIESNAAFRGWINLVDAFLRVFVKEMLQAVRLSSSSILRNCIRILSKKTCSNCSCLYLEKFLENYTKTSLRGFSKAEQPSFIKKFTELLMLKWKIKIIPILFETSKQKSFHLAGAQFFFCVMELLKSVYLKRAELQQRKIKKNVLKNTLFSLTFYNKNFLELCIF